MLCVTHVTTLSWFMNTGLREVQYRGLYCDVNYFDPKCAIQCNVQAFYCGNPHKDEVLKKCHNKFKRRFPGIIVSSMSTIYRLVNIFRTKFSCS